MIRFGKWVSYFLLAMTKCSTRTTSGRKGFLGLKCYGCPVLHDWARVLRLMNEIAHFPLIPSRHLAHIYSMSMEIPSQMCPDVCLLFTASHVNNEV